MKIHPDILKGIHVDCMTDSPLSKEETEREAREILASALDFSSDQKFQIWAAVEVTSEERGMVVTIPAACALLGEFSSYELALGWLKKLQDLSKKGGK